MSKPRLAAFSILLVLGTRLWWRIETEAPVGGPPARVTIPQGASTQAIAEKLAAASVVKRAWTFALLVRIRGDAARMKAGTYLFEGPYSALDVEQKLVLGDVERRAVTFPEGRNVFEMAEIASRAGLATTSFLAAAMDPAAIADLDPEARNLEGYLFPQTYDIIHGSTEKALAAEMVRHARTVFTEMGLTTSGRTIGGTKLSLREIVTLASIVELETAAPEERPIIAGVFLNRLKKRMRLQTDPTVIYALKLQGRYDGNIRKVDLADVSPYNTYQIAGLPPGPIGSPGRAALSAVLEPEATDALYFVSRNDGTHVFSKTLREHERAVDEYQRRRARAHTSKAPTADFPK